MTLWLTEDESSVYLFSVPPESKESLIHCLKLIKGEPLASPAAPPRPVEPVSTLSPKSVEPKLTPTSTLEEQKKRIEKPPTFTVTPSNTRIQIKVRL